MLFSVGAFTFIYMLSKFSLRAFNSIQYFLLSGDIIAVCFTLAFLPDVFDNYIYEYNSFKISVVTHSWVNF